MAGYLKYADFDSTLLRFNCIGFYVILDFGFCKKKKILNLQVQGFKLKVTESANKFPFWKLCSCKYSTHNRAQEAQTIDTYIAMRIFKFLFQVTHKIDQKIMVLKRNKHRANRSSMLKEVQLMNTLNHENILK